MHLAGWRKEEEPREAQSGRDEVRELGRAPTVSASRVRVKTQLRLWVRWDHGRAFEEGCVDVGSITRPSWLHHVSGVW